MPTYKSKFQNKTRFYLHFLTCAWIALQQEKIAFRNFCSFTHFVLKNEKMKILP